ncbi:hypothetical protein OsI_33118 [Oryza sativa Indica Group]|uniref:Uncharacterized protein n=1 Tax=Oryza sativa subsp. indica TaxID=39946 RepID=A2Z640_ORYSI|nr:hypothetical protein OsI_33118 [Oryza sativa Indica Group]
MNRSRLFAEAVVIMVCPVLAVSLGKVEPEIGEHGRHAVPIIMLVFAAITLITGNVPFLILCFSKFFYGDWTWKLPVKVTRWLAPLSGTCLVVLACWITRLIFFDRWPYPVLGAMVGLGILIRAATNYILWKEETNPDPNLQLPNDHRSIKKLDSKLEKSVELLSGGTALLFLGLEGLALEGGQGEEATSKHRLSKPICVSFLACVCGLYSMMVGMIPPRPRGGIRLILSGIPDETTREVERYVSGVIRLTLVFDAAMIVAIVFVMFLVMYTLMKLPAFLLLAPPFLILIVTIYYAIFDDPGGSDNGAATMYEYPKPASLELTKVTFAGFLAVSIPVIGNGSLSTSADLFLTCAASAVASGLVWRFLTHDNDNVSLIPQRAVERAAHVASFCAHLLIVIATVPFTIMAANALHSPMKNAG